MVVGLGLVFFFSLLLWSTIKVSRLHLGAVILLAAGFVPAPASAHQEGTDPALETPGLPGLDGYGVGNWGTRARLGTGEAGNGARSEGVGRCETSAGTAASSSAWALRSAGLRGLPRVPAPPCQKNPRAAFWAGEQRKPRRWGLCVSQVLSNRRARKKHRKCLFYWASGAGLASPFCPSGRWFFSLWASLLISDPGVFFGGVNLLVMVSLEWRLVGCLGLGWPEP